MKARKILSMIMALAMVISMMSVGVYAEGDPDTLITTGGTVTVNNDETVYDSLTEAAEQATAIEGVITYTIDGAVEYITGTELSKDGAEVKIIGKTDAETDSVTLREYYHLGFQSEGKLTIENVTINDLSDYDSKRGDTYPNGCENSLTNWEFMNITFNRGTEASVICNNVTFTEGVAVWDAKATFNDCTFNVFADEWAKSKYALWIGSDKEVVVKDCEFSGDRAIKIDDTYGDNVVNVVIEKNQFNNLSQKPAIVYSNDAGGNVELTENNVLTETYGKGVIAVEAPVELTGTDIDTLKAAVTIDGETTFYTSMEEAEAAAAEEEAEAEAIVAKDEGMIYTSFEAALAAAGEDAVIDLLGNEVKLGATLNADKNITIKNGTIDATGVEFEQFGVFVDEGETITFEDVDFVLDNAKAYQGFFYNQGTVTFNGGSVVADGTDAPAIFHGGELETAGKFVINGTEITLSALVNGDEGGRGFLYPTLDIDDATITMTDLTDNAMRSVAGTVDNSTITVDGAEYGIKNKGFEGVLTVTNSEITISNTQNEDGANAGIYLESEEGLLTDENSEINSSIYIPATEEGGEPTIYYVLSFANCELSSVQELNGTEIDLAEYIPTRDGYTFSGWYTDADCTEGNEIDSIVLDADITVYAAWTKNRTSGGNGGLQAGGDTSNKGADDLGQKGDAEDKTEEQTPVTPVTPAAHPFADVNSGDWYNAAVEYVYKNGLMNGTAEDEFSPNATLTRAMLVTVLYRAEGSPATNKSIPFGDVDMGAYYADAVIWAKQNGIVNGVTENDFAPNANITREQIAAIMHRYAQYKGHNVSVAAELTGFADAKNVSAYAVDAMKYAVGAGVINGKTATTVNPAEFATRAELATILMRFIENNK